MKDISQIKKKYQSNKVKLFQKLASTNDGFYFNKNHTDLVDTVVKEIVKGIYNIYPIEDFSLIAVGGYGRHDLSPKSDVDLLFIYKKSNKNIRDFITQLNNTLWDIGLEVGISFLTIKQALIDSKKDIKTITKFVESRFIIGDEIQYGEFVRSIKILIGKQNPLKLSELKLIELVERHDYRIGIKSNLEPNIKEGIGGLRDIHTILWVSIFMFNIYKLEDLTSINIYTKEEIKELKNAWKFLLTIRAFIHLFNESKGDVLSIENQLKISKKLSYKDKKKEKGVEIFMKDLFVNVAKINSLLRTFYSKLPEDLIIKTIYKRKPTKTKSLEKEFIIDSWAPYYLEGLEKGEVNLKLELIDEKNNLIKAIKYLKKYILHDYRLTFRSKLCVADIEYKKGSSVQGALFEITEKDDSYGKGVLFIFLGLLGLIVGSYYCVLNAEIVAKIIGVPDLIIGLTIMAIGTSLPELAATIAALIQRKGAMVVGNILGSNILNVVLVVPIIGFFSYIELDSAIFSRDFLLLVILSLLFVITVILNQKKFFPLIATRTFGFVFISVYVLYVLRLSGLI